MHYGLIRLKNYIGIYNGLQLHEIIIDFTKCKHKMVIIKGDNGSGKSTLFKALNPLPDSNDNFIPGMQAEKELNLFDNNTMYTVKFIHSIKNNGERDTTKGYIYKYNNISNNYDDLNPNGNISSFKDILYSEFKLDANFVALSQLSTEDRGLADKKPAQRKKFINSIVETLEVYNNIHKTLTKRSSIFKSMINSLTSKLSSIGDENKLKNTLVSIDSRLSNLMIQKDNYIESMASHKSTINMIDPDGSIQNRYDNIILKLDTINYDMNILMNKIKNMITKLNLQSNIDIVEIYNQTLKSKSDVLINIQIQESKINSLLNDRENEAKFLNTKIQRLNSIKSEKDYDELILSIEEYKNKIILCENIFDKIGIDKNTSLSKDEYIIGLNTLNEIKNMIDNFKSGIEYDIMQEAIINYIIKDKYPDIETIDINIKNTINSINTLNISFNEYNLLKDISSRLNMRPKRCTIDDCEFIKDSILAFEQNPEEHIRVIEKETILRKNELIQYEKLKTKNIKIIECINSIKNILRSIDGYSPILKKIPNGDIFWNRDIFITSLLNGETFEEINDLYRYIDYANVFEEYSIYKNTLYQLEADYKIYSSKNSIINEISIDIDNINNKLKYITNEIESSDKNLLKYKSNLFDLSNREVEYKTLISYIEEFDILKSEKSRYDQDLKDIQTNITTIKNSLSEISIINNSLNNISNEIIPLSEDKDKIKHAIALSIDYNIELADYKNRYDKIETIKYYSSPTTGIQLIFMDLYMSNVISMANQLLSYLFNGEYVLQQFIINEDEFRIPCKSENGMLNDDISSMSNAQISMISMILSFALLFQSSSKYNILKVDEIDSCLDYSNRLQFLNLLQMQMEILECNQCIMISHNSELNTMDCDIILLKTNNTDNIEGNIIFKYC